MLEPSSEYKDYLCNGFLLVFGHRLEKSSWKGERSAETLQAIGQKLPCKCWMQRVDSSLDVVVFGG
jgi:hypothetical protein